MKRPLHQDSSEWIAKLTEKCEVSYDKGYRDGHEAGYKAAFDAISNIIYRVLKEIKP